MKMILFLFCLAYALITGPKLQSQCQSKPFVFTHVSVIDATGAPINSDMTIVITGNHISEIVETEKVRLPSEATVIDGSGKFLIPGLWDMHVHWYLKDYLPLFIANGITGIRQMSGFPLHLQWRKEIEKGTLLGPRMIIASPIVDGPVSALKGTISVANEAEARNTVIKLKQGGADFIKVYSMIPRGAYYAIADETKKQGIAFAGHVPRSVSANEASDAGQKSIEHLTGVLEACSTRDEEVRRGIEETFLNPAEGGTPTPENIHAILRKTRVFTRLMLETYSREKANALFALFKKNHTWQCPTLIALRNLSSLDDPDLQNDPRLKYMPYYIKTAWDPKNDFRNRAKAAEDYELAKMTYKRQVELIGIMHSEGVEFLTGTDVFNPYCFPGFSLHDELSLMVKAGLSPMEALQAATRNPAVYLGMSDSMGTIEKGKVANLVLLDANPLDDITNTTRIAAVMIDGRVFDRSELDIMLAKIQQYTANKKSIAEPMFRLIEEQGCNAAIEQYRELRTKEYDNYNFSESELNSLGYRLVQLKRFRDAIEIFKLNAEIYPHSSNAYDSLGEAYLLNGDKDLAIKNYKRSVELDPTNKNGIEKLKSLERQ